jgi:hypothetical protein
MCRCFPFVLSRLRGAHEILASRRNTIMSRVYRHRFYTLFPNDSRHIHVVRSVTPGDREVVRSVVGAR